MYINTSVPRERVFCAKALLFHIPNDRKLGENGNFPFRGAAYLAKGHRAPCMYNAIL
jgi:hypothetical protein